ncbi:two-component regulator propeller domain-containing protein [uncultured Paludibaculum sp.]|uniref:hybrid sensor histidine kinase/response regulator n=1 Tax=uncultured Paludibaculum sp. TaxID=1765020 RepID=UPI002AABDD61|nr:two-component regulator propeller domain-containing protein [uncultured Paludibaculum sp.]
MRAFATAVCAVFCALLVSPALHAHQYQFRLYGRQDGLGNLAISAITQDQTGYLWVGTQNGLYRYDGHSFQELGYRGGMPNDPIVALHAGSDGSIWAATRTRLFRSTFSGFQEISLGRKVQFLTRSVLASRNGKLYAATNAGLLELAPAAGRDQWQVRPIPIETHGVPVRAVSVDPHGGLWAAGDFGVCHWQNGRSTLYAAKEGVPDEHWDSLLPDGQGGLWARGVGHLVHLARGGARFELEQPGPPDASFQGVIIRSWDGTLLASTRRGLALKQNGKWSLVSMDEGLPASSTTVIFEDREGSIWLGTWGVGLCRWLGGTLVESWSARDGLPHESVNAIARDSSGLVWVGTDTGLGSLRSGETSTSLAALAETKVRALQGDRDTLWAGLYPGGVARIDLRTRAVRRFGVAQGLKDERVNGLHLDRSGRLWVCTMRGLYILEGDRFVSAVQGVPTDEIFLRVSEDPQGGIWVATSKGLRLWRNGVWRLYTALDGLAQDSVAQVRAPSATEVWVGYRGSKGISRLHFEGDRLRSVEQVGPPKLPSNHVLSIGYDSEGDMWVGTDSGIGLRRKGVWSTISKADGLIWDDCNPNSLLAEGSGDVWIGTSRGLTHIVAGAKPRLLAGQPPQPVLSSIQFGGRRMPSSIGLRIPYAQRLLELDLACLSFRQEQQIRYRYRLTGLEDAWVETATPELRFPSLPPGSYRLEVLAANSVGETSAAPALAQFVIQPPWYGTWWFYLTLVALAVLSIIYLIRWRTATLQRRSRELEEAVRARTEELQSQYELAGRQKTEIERLLDEANQLHRAKNEFLANISHEIRTPMNGILGLTELALHTQLDHEQLEYVQATRKSAESLLGLLNDVLDFAKIEAQRIEIESAPFSIRDCFDLVRDTFASQAIDKGLDVHIEIDSGVPQQVLGDTLRIGQVIMNLVGNAVKFTENGSVILRAGLEAAIGDFVRLRIDIRDTGIGIPPDKLKMIFEPFRQADGSTARNYGGTGLGLSISARLVEIMGGRLTVESTPGVGSVFSFTLPLKQVKATAGTPVEKIEAAQPAGDVVPARVLLAEDHQINQLVVIRLLEKRGHHVDAVNNGAEAVAAASSGSYDLILMDMQMPVMDGLQAAHEIRALAGPAARIPIVALTANALGAAEEECRAAGMDAYLAKPVKPDELYRVVESITAASAKSLVR